MCVSHLTITLEKRFGGMVACVRATWLLPLGLRVETFFVRIRRDLGWLAHLNAHADKVLTGEAIAVGDLARSGRY